MGINRGNAGLSQSEFAEALGISRRTVVNWESDKFVPLHPNLEQISSFFSNELGSSISVEDLSKKDLTGCFELMPLTDLEREMTPKQRRIIKSLFLSARKLNETQLREVVKFVSTLTE